MDCPFNIEHLFATGLGFDLGGAWLVSRGLMSPAATIARRSATLWNGNPQPAVDQVRDSIDAPFGLACLLLGFGMQGLGYILVIATDPAVPEATFVAVTLAAVALLLPVIFVAIWTRTQRIGLVKRKLVAVARYNVNEQRLDPNPDLGKLAEFARILGEPALNEEKQEAHVRRVFNIRPVTE